MISANLCIYLFISCALFSTFVLIKNLSCDYFTICGRFLDNWTLLSVILEWFVLSVKADSYQISQNKWYHWIFSAHTYFFFWLKIISSDSRFAVECIPLNGWYHQTYLWIYMDTVLCIWQQWQSLIYNHLWYRMKQKCIHIKLCATNQAEQNFRLS